MASRTGSVASAPTSSVTAKRSMANERCCAPAGPASAVSSAAARRARLIRLASERDLGHLPILRTLQLEVLVGAELEEARDEIGRELLDRRIEVAHDGVEVAAGGLDRLLDLADASPAGPG